MRTEGEIRERLTALEAEYDRHDPPVSQFEEETEVAVLRAIEELEWVLGEFDWEGRSPSGSTAESRDDEEFTG